MGSAGRGYIWMMRALFLGLALILLFAQLLPLETAPRGWVAPDFLLALSCVFVARRPDLVPVWLLAIVFLLADLLLQRPPGLWAAAAIVATEALRARVADLKDMIFAAEWAIVGAILFSFYFCLALVWSLLVPYEISTGLLALQMVLTIAVYGPIAGICGLAFGLRKAAPGETDALGRRL